VDCAWNDAICKGVALTFAMAVESFARADDALQYSWLDYLPTELKQDRWKILYPTIQQHLRQRPILQTWTTGKLRIPGKLRRLPENMQHDGEPILGDLQDEEYLAPYYASKHYRALAALGAVCADIGDMVKRLEMDLCNPKTSKVMTTKPRDSWHEAFALLFLTPFVTPSTKTVHDDSTIRAGKRMKILAFIPLKGRKQWTGAPGASRGGLPKLYFSTRNGVPIPDNLGLKLLDEVASSKTQQRRFYKALGVEECPEKLVVTKIKEYHERPERPAELANVHSHFQYLYRIGEDPSSLKTWIWTPVDDDHGVLSSEKLYFPSQGTHDLYQLFSSLSSVNKAKLNDIATFMDLTLFQLEAEGTNTQDITWEDWLQKATGARHYPPLIEENGVGVSDKPSLSPVLHAVRKYRSAMFLSTLKAHWEDYQDDAAMVGHDLRVCKVRCISTDRAPLQTCYLPTKEVIERVLEMDLAPADFPILSLQGLNTANEKLDKAGYRQWRFLEEFGARPQPDLEFYKQALRKIKGLRQYPTLDILKNVYRYMAELATARDQKDLRYVKTRRDKLEMTHIDSTFFSKGFVWDPTKGCWQSLDTCNWRGPNFMHYTSVLAISYGNDPLLKTFFSDTLGMVDTCTRNVTDELFSRSECEVPTSVAVAREIYKFLDTNDSLVKDWEELRYVVVYILNVLLLHTTSTALTPSRPEFEESSLVLGSDNTWHTLDTCIWQSPFLLSGYQDLSLIYPELESFFTNHLKVRKATPSMLVKEISQMAAKSEPDIDKVRRRLVEVGLIVARGTIDKATEDALDELKKLNFLPQELSDGSTGLLAVGDEFAIPDHVRYSKAFIEHDVLLNFTVEEVQMLSTIFHYLKLEGSYLSVMVTEESTVGGDAHIDNVLSQEVQDKAYALYW
jgi:hypothetical protein